MTFEQATKFIQIDWEQPEHDEKRNTWKAGRSKINKESPKDMKNLDYVVNNFDDGTKKLDAIGKQSEYHSGIDGIDNVDDPQLWKHYKKFINPDKENKA